MKGKILFLGALILAAFLVIPRAASAETAVVEKILVESSGDSVTISITSNETLQIETFKNDESSTSYIVLDFLGVIYTNLPAIINVNKGAVEKVSLVKAQGKPNSSLGTDYYALDFLAINLNKAADYSIKQSKAVIDLSIGDSGSMQQTVDLNPPIVISKEKKPDQKSSTAQRERHRVSRVGKDTSASSTAGEKKPRRRRRRPEPEKNTTPATTNISFGSQKQRVRGNAPENKTPEKEVVPKKETVSPKVSLAARDSQELIDQIVSDTIREKEKTSSKIDTLTYELKKLQEELSLSKGEKSKLDEKIRQILAKLDELQNALDEEIRRRQALGEAVEDLISRRERYLKAKQVYEELSSRLNQISAEAEKMSAEVASMKDKFTEARIEKKRLETEADNLERRYTQVKNNLDKMTQVKGAVSEKIHKLAAEIEKLKKELKKSVDEKDQIVKRMGQLESESKSDSNKLSRLRQLVAEKNVNLLELEGNFKRLRASLDSVLEEKEKIESAYNNAKTEFNRIKAEIEQYLKEKIKR